MQNNEMIRGRQVQIAKYCFFFLMYNIQPQTFVKYFAHIYVDSKFNLYAHFIGN